MTNFNDLMGLFRRTRKHQWRKEWQDRLSVLLEAATQKLKTNIVFVVAEESDPYSELLFLFSFVGVSFGSFFGLFLKIFKFDLGIDLYVFPLLGFTAFGLFHTRKALWLRKVFRILAEKRVLQKARSYFYEYHSNPTIPMILIYISDAEKRIEILRTPDLISQLSPSKVEEIQKGFYDRYVDGNPLQAVEPLIQQLVTTLAPYRQDLPVRAESGENNFSPPIFVPASDVEIKIIPMLKGSKDIN